MWAYWNFRTFLQYLFWNYGYLQTIKFVNRKIPKFHTFFFVANFISKQMVWRLRLGLDPVVSFRSFWFQSFPLLSLSLSLLCPCVSLYASFSRLFPWPSAQIWSSFYFSSDVQEPFFLFFWWCRRMFYYCSIESKLSFLSLMQQHCDKVGPRRVEGGGGGGGEHAIIFR